MSWHFLGGFSPNDHILMLGKVGKREDKYYRQLSFRGITIYLVLSTHYYIGVNGGYFFALGA